MTSGRQAKAARRAAGTNTVDPRDDDEVAVYLGWAPDEPDKLEQVHGATRRKLCEMTAGARTGDVEIEELRGVDADALLSELTARTSNETALNTQRRFRGLLREYGGVIVIAKATARKRQQAGS